MSAPAYSPPTNSSPMRHHIRWQQASDHSVSDPVCERRFADQPGEHPLLKVQGPRGISDACKVMSGFRSGLTNWRCLQHSFYRPSRHRVKAQLRLSPCTCYDNKTTNTIYSNKYQTNTSCFVTPTSNCRCTPECLIPLLSQCIVRDFFGFDCRAAKRAALINASHRVPSALFAARAVIDPRN
jgi:hypothetical protein